MRIRHGIAALAVGILAGVYETAVWGFVPSAATGVHPVIPVIAFLVLNEQPTAAICFAIAVGLVSDVFSVDASGFMLGGYVCIALLLGLMARSVFTNRSLYASVAICLVGRLAENAWLAAANIFQGDHWSAGLTLVTASHWWSVPVWDTSIMASVFTIGLFLRRRLGGRRVGGMSVDASRYV